MADEDIEKAATLRNLLVVEREGARSLIDGGNGSGDVYASGRVGGYDFAIAAIDARWPNLPNTFELPYGTDTPPPSVG